MNECKNLYIIDKVKVFNIVKINGKINIEDCENIKVNEMLTDNNDIHKFVFVPYVPNGRFIEALDTKKEYIGNYSDVTSVFAHQEFYGAKYNGLVSHNGDKIEGIFPTVISGHIHEYNTFKNVTYVGSSRQIYKKDDPNKTISIFSFKYKNCIEETRIDLNLRRKIIMESNVINVMNLVFPDNAVIYLMISGNSSEIKALKKNQIFRNLEKNKNLKISYNIIDPDPIDTVYNGKLIDIKNENVSYITRLKNKLGSNPEQLKLFDKIFNL
jgi:hypothetical protein